MADPTTAPIPTISPHDLVIAVMGITGSGKSSFISRIVGGEVVIGHNLTSCTTQVGLHSFIYKSTRRVFLIDTPGFDDTTRTDAEVLKDVAFFLSQTYKQTIRLAGIIYLHRITDKRMQGSSVKNISMFRKLCGENAYKQVILATTMWDALPIYDEGVQRETELVATKAWWGLMHERGSKVLRHSGDKDSAMSIVEELLKDVKPIVLDIQREMVDEHMNLEDTAAGKEVEKELEEAKARFRENIREIEEDHRKALAEKDNDLADVLQQQRAEYDDKLQKAAQGQEDLKMNLERLEKEKEEEILKLVSDLQKQQDVLREVRAQQEAELQRIDTARKEDQAEYEKLRAKHDRELEKCHENLRDIARRHNETEAAREKAEAARLKDLKAELERDYARREELAARKQVQLQQEVRAIQARRSESGSTARNLAILNSVLGIGVAIAGTLTLNPAMVGLGAGMTATGDAGL